MERESLRIHEKVVMYGILKTAGPLNVLRFGHSTGRHRKNMEQYTMERRLTSTGLGELIVVRERDVQRFDL